MASRLLADLMGDHAPRRMRAFLDGCTQARAAMRPQDTWALLGELDELLESLYGPRTFRPFRMPNRHPGGG